MTVLIRILFFVLGVAFSQIAEAPIKKQWERGYDIWCGGGAALAAGKEAFTKAIRESRPELFSNAKTAFEKAAYCGAGEASFLLGLQYCNGYGVKKDVAHGRRLLREAVSREEEWAMEILTTPELCKAETR